MDLSSGCYVGSRSQAGDSGPELPDFLLEFELAQGRPLQVSPVMRALGGRRDLLQLSDLSQPGYFSVKIVDRLCR
jgi:hypothetical protein